MKSIGLIKPYLIENRLFIFLGLASLIAVDILQLIIPRVIKWAVDDLTAIRIDGTRLLIYAFYITAIACFIGIFRYFWRLFLLGVSRRVEEGLRNQFFQHIQTLSPSYFDRTKTGDLMAHATNDIMHIRLAIGMGIVAITDAILLGAASIGFMAYINVKLTLFVLIPMPLIVFGTRFFSKKMHRRYGQVQASFSDLTESVRERISGIRIIKAFTRESESIMHLDNKSKEYVDKNLRLVRITGSFFPLMMLVSNLSMALVLFLGGRLTIFGTITPGDFVAFIAYLGIITWPMMALGWVVNLIQRGKASLDRINRILETRPQIYDPKSADTLPELTDHIEFRNVSFDYDSPAEDTTEYIEKSSHVLSDISFHLTQGQTLGIVGPPGGGKSTILSLIPRLYDVCYGQILIDGIDIRNIQLAQLRSRISFVPQEPFLFAGTIRENILFENGIVDEQQLIRAVSAASMHETIRDFPKGFDTIVGEKGVVLSGGQKQRIALARALLHDRPILLLDDPISQVDMETGANIVKAIREMSRTKTTIIVSHRLSALSFADNIIVLDKGKIIANGTHTRLMEQNTYYSGTYQLQEIEEAFYAE
ncbi:MAG: ABC transporter ATP-binding protein/permease [Desulfobacterales bacterium]|nr:ABC transporter ATP-binding protein/permease [Desulfobacterales bacterium]